jgi:ribonuclease Z
VASACALALVGYVALSVPAVADTVAARMIEQRLTERHQELFEPDALRVFFCGTSSPLPHPTRAQSCVAIFAADRFWVVDTGPGSTNTLGLLGIDLSRIGGVFLTHFHSDHIGDLGELNMQSWAAGRILPLQVFGPPGVERIVSGFTEAYAFDRQYRTGHHGASFMPVESSKMNPAAIAEPRYGEGPRTVLEVDGLKITAFPVRHDPVRPAYGYRFDYLGRSVVLSGDTARTPSLVAAAHNADVLVHEALAPHLTDEIASAADDLERPRVAKIMRDIRDYHTSTIGAAQVANEVDAKLLVLTHLVPPPPNRMAERIFTRGIDEVRAEGWLLADDGMLITLPTESDVMEVEQL